MYFSCVAFGVCRRILTSFSWPWWWVGLPTDEAALEAVGNIDCSRCGHKLSSHKRSKGKEKVGRCSISPISPISPISCACVLNAEAFCTDGMCGKLPGAGSIILAPCPYDPITYRAQALSDTNTMPLWPYHVPGAGSAEAAAARAVPCHRVCTNQAPQHSRVYRPPDVLKLQRGAAGTSSNLSHECTCSACALYHEYDSRPDALA